MSEPEINLNRPGFAELLRRELSVLLQDRVKSDVSIRRLDIGLVDWVDDELTMARRIAERIAGAIGSEKQ